MIESIIKHIQDQGFDVAVYPGVISVRKLAGAQLYGYDWTIPKEELHVLPLKILLEEADYRISLLRRAISGTTATDGE